MSTLSPLSLSDDEFEALAEGLDRFSDLDTDGLLGLFHAVAVAPALVLPSAWLPVVAPGGFGGRDSRQVDEFFGLVMRQYNEVIDALEHGQVICPDPEDAVACESFAAGFVAGAELVPEWIGDADRWTFATPFAYLAGRLDLVPKAELAKIEHELGPDPKQITRREMAACIAAANTSFEEHRLATSQLSGAPAPRIARVGRNEPCPCGSGKKYKRCCAA